MAKEKNNNDKKVNNAPKQGNPRDLALKVLQQVAEDGAYANLALSAQLERSGLNAADRRLATRLVYGVLREQALLDHILLQFLRGGKGFNKLPLKIKICLRLGLYQLWRMDKIPVSAAINESVKLAKKHGHQGTAGLVNAVLRNIDRSRDEVKLPTKESDPAEYLSVCYSHPRWLVDMWLDEFGYEVTEALCRHDNAAEELCLRVNTLRTTRDELTERLNAAGMQAEPGKYAPEALLVTESARAELQNIIDEGLVYPQHQSSMLAAHALNPQPGSRVVDLCAAPGGKTTHLAQLMENKGEIRGFDLHPHKIKLIEDNCRRLGIDIVKAAAGDSRKPPKELNGWADYVLADVPCSGLGVLRTRPDARWQKQPEEVNELAVIAAEILDAAAKIVKPGGVLLFSTCTVTHKENAENARAFLARHPEFEPEALAGILAPWADGDAFLRIMPHLHGLDGFFLARFRRVK